MQNKLDKMFTLNFYRNQAQWKTKVTDKAKDTENIENLCIQQPTSSTSSNRIGQDVMSGLNIPYEDLYPVGRPPTVSTRLAILKELSKQVSPEIASVRSSDDKQIPTIDLSEAANCPLPDSFESGNVDNDLDVEKMTVCSQKGAADKIEREDTQWHVGESASYAENKAFGEKALDMLEEIKCRMRDVHGTAAMSTPAPPSVDDSADGYVEFMRGMHYLPQSSVMNLNCIDLELYRPQNFNTHMLANMNQRQLTACLLHQLDTCKMFIKEANARMQLRNQMVIKKSDLSSIFEPCAMETDDVSSVNSGRIIKSQLNNTI